MDKSSISIVRDDIFLLYINLVGTGIALLSAIFHLGWIAATIDITVLSALYVYHIIRRKDALLTRMLIFGVSAGVTELFADHWLVSIKQTLVYNPGGWFLWDSPFYMPFSWAGMLLSVACLGVFLYKRMPFWKATLIAAIVMGIYVPTYEGLAYYANWWLYKDAPALGPVPWFIILGEFLIALPLAFFGLFITKRHILFAVLAGILEGLWIWGAYAIAWKVTGS